MEFYQLIRKMEYQVNRHVKHYQNDFYGFDIPSLAKIATTAEPCKLAWFIRDTGTDIMKFHDSNQKIKLGSVLLSDFSDCEKEERFRENNDMEFRITYTPVEYQYGTWTIEKVR